LGENGCLIGKNRKGPRLRGGESFDHVIHQYRSIYLYTHIYIHIYIDMYIGISIYLSNYLYMYKPTYKFIYNQCSGNGRLVDKNRKGPRLCVCGGGGGGGWG